MLYRSTEGTDTTYTFSEALCHNLSPEGGLFVPVDLPVLSPIDDAAMRSLDFVGRFAYFLDFFTQGDPLMDPRINAELSPNILENLCREAFSDFQLPEPGFKVPCLNPYASRTREYLFPLDQGPTAWVGDYTAALLGVLLRQVLPQIAPAPHILVLPDFHPLEICSLARAHRDEDSWVPLFALGKSQVSPDLLRRLKALMPLENAHLYGLEGNPWEINLALLALLDHKEIQENFVREGIHLLLFGQTSLLPTIVACVLMGVGLTYWNESPDLDLEFTNSQDIAFPALSTSFLLGGLYLKTMIPSLQMVFVGGGPNLHLMEFLQKGHLDAKALWRPALTLGQGLISIAQISQLIYFLTGGTTFLVQACKARLFSQGTCLLKKELQKAWHRYMKAVDVQEADLIAFGRDIYDDLDYGFDADTLTAFFAVRSYFQKPHALRSHQHVLYFSPSHPLVTAESTAAILDLSWNSEDQYAEREKSYELLAAELGIDVPLGLHGGELTYPVEELRAEELAQAILGLFAEK